MLSSIACRMQKAEAYLMRNPPETGSGKSSGPPEWPPYVARLPLGAPERAAGITRAFTCSAVLTGPQQAGVEPVECLVSSLGPARRPGLKRARRCRTAD